MAARSRPREDYGRHHVAQADSGNTRELTLKNDLDSQRLGLDGEHLSHLRFDDDIPMCANTPHERQ